MHKDGYVGFEKALSIRCKRKLLISDEDLKKLS